MHGQHIFIVDFVTLDFVDYINTYFRASSYFRENALCADDRMFQIEVSQF